MSSSTRWTSTLPAVVLAISLFGCDEAKDTASAAASSSPSATATAAPAKTSAPSATVAVVKPSHPCPKDSEGDGTRHSPCDAKGTSRVMEATWTGKIGDKGPFFRVINKTKLEILYGDIVVYFYDKAGKQLEVTTSGKPRPSQPCGGNIFAGPMKAGEKAVLNFSCVKKKHVPEGTAAIEGELRMVGFTAKSGKTSDTFWRNKDLVPKQRPKGGIK